MCVHDKCIIRTGTGLLSVYVLFMFIAFDKVYTSLIGFMDIAVGFIPCCFRFIPIALGFTQLVSSDRT